MNPEQEKAIRERAVVALRVAERPVKNLDDALALLQALRATAVDMRVVLDVLDKARAEVARLRAPIDAGPLDRHGEPDEPAPRSPTDTTST